MSTQVSRNIIIYFDEGDPVEKLQRMLEQSDTGDLVSITLSSYNEDSFPLNKEKTKEVIELLKANMKRTQSLRICYCHNAHISAIIDHLHSHFSELENLEVHKGGSPGFPLYVLPPPPDFSPPSFTSLDTIALSGYAVLLLSDYFRGTGTIGDTQISTITLSNVTRSDGFERDVLTVPGFVRILAFLMGPSSTTIVLKDIDLDPDYDEEDVKKAYEGSASDSHLFGVVETVEYVRVCPGVIDWVSSQFPTDPTTRNSFVSEQIYDECALEDCRALLPSADRIVLRNIDHQLLSFFFMANCKELHVKKCTGFNDEALSFLKDPRCSTVLKYRMTGLYSLHLEDCESFTFKALVTMLNDRQAAAQRAGVAYNDYDFDPDDWEVCLPVMYLTLSGTSKDLLYECRKDILDSYVHLELE